MHLLARNAITPTSGLCRLLLRFAAEPTGQQPSELDIADLDALLMASLLDHPEHLEHHHGNSMLTLPRRGHQRRDARYVRC